MPARERVILGVSEDLSFAAFESLVAQYRETLTNSVSRTATASIDGSRVLYKVKKLKQNLAQTLESLFVVFPSWSAVTSFTIRYRINVEENAVDQVAQLSAVIKKQRK